MRNLILFYLFCFVSATVHAQDASDSQLDQLKALHSQFAEMGLSEQSSLNSLIMVNVWAKADKTEPVASVPVMYALKKEGDNKFRFKYRGSEVGDCSDVSSAFSQEDLSRLVMTHYFQQSMNAAGVAIRADSVGMDMDELLKQSFEVASVFFALGSDLSDTSRHEYSATCERFLITD